MALARTSTHRDRKIERERGRLKDVTLSVVLVGAFAMSSSSNEKEEAESQMK